uniref:Uncharacterized protein n=2 Tax=Lotharella globosa TaxID=91324 RepID=A0A7S4DY23_9EUKA
MTLTRQIHAFANEVFDSRWMKRKPEVIIWYLFAILMLCVFLPWSGGTGIVPRHGDPSVAQQPVFPAEVNIEPEITSLSDRMDEPTELVKDPVMTQLEGLRSSVEEIKMKLDQLLKPLPDYGVASSGQRVVERFDSLQDVVDLDEGSVEKQDALSDDPERGESESWGAFLGQRRLGLMMD